MKRYLVVISLPIFLFVTAYLCTPFINRYLVYTKQVKQGTLIIEGWVSDHTLEKALENLQYRNFNKIISVGLEASEYYIVSMNGYLVFDVKGFLDNNNQVWAYRDSTIMLNTLDVGAYGSLNDEHCAHFYVLVNDTVLGEYCAGTNKRYYRATWPYAISVIDSVSVYFDNDAMGSFGDHNLFVKDLRLNDSIVIPYKNNSHYRRIPEGWKKIIPLDYSSWAGYTRNRLLELGVDSSLIYTLPAQRYALNRTLSSALTVKQWIHDSHYNDDYFTVISQGIHARRTYNTYAAVLDSVRPDNIGVIAIGENVGTRRSVMQTLLMLRELSNLIYYKIILLFYS